MRHATIDISDLRVGDTIIRKSLDNPFDFQKVTRVDHDVIFQVYFVYVNNASLYYTISEGAQVTIQIN
jgi:hypothetical protein